MRRATVSFGWAFVATLITASLFTTEAVRSLNLGYLGLVVPISIGLVSGYGVGGWLGLLALNLGETASYAALILLNVITPPSQGEIEMTILAFIVIWLVPASISYLVGWRIRGRQRRATSSAL